VNVYQCPSGDRPAGFADCLPVLRDDRSLRDLLQSDFEAEGDGLDSSQISNLPAPRDLYRVSGLDFLNGGGHIILRMHDERAFRGHGSTLLERSLLKKPPGWGFLQAIPYSGK
jgi:hypothetical protein